jgi:acid stress-induced BolA-like protein IbaG/YrbA
MQRLSKSRLQEILTEELGLKEPRFRLEKTGSRLNGSIISPTFKGKRDLRRQQMIWNALQRALGSDAVRRVGMLLAFTPEEWDIDDILVTPARPRAKAG